MIIDAYCKGLLIGLYDVLLSYIFLEFAFSLDLDDLDDFDFDETSDSETSIVSLCNSEPISFAKMTSAVRLSFSSFPSSLLGLFNVGDMGKLKNFIKGTYADDCRFKMNLFHKEYFMAGDESIFLLFNAVLNSHPDGVFCLKSCDVSESKSMIYIKMKMAFAGTVCESSHVDHLMSGDFSKLISNLSDNVESNAKRRKLKLRLVERELKTGNKLPSIYLKLSDMLCVDKNSGKIVYSTNKTVLSSFKVMDK